MKHYFFAFILSIIALAFCQCSSKDGKGSVPEFNEHVDGFTSGRISRKASAFLILATDIESSRLQELDPNKFMSISPSAKGSFSFADAHTIVFKPQGDLSYNTVYTITADMDKIFKDDSKDFSFSFETYPFQMSATMDSFDETENDEYVYTFHIRTLDEEDPDVVHSLITHSAGESAKVEWTKENQYLHEMKISFTPKAEGLLTLSSVENSTYNVKDEQLISVDIPNPNTLSVYDIRYVSDETKYIEVAFNKQLDKNQNMMGLAYIEDNKSKAVEVSGNKIKLFPDTNKDKNEVVVHLSKNIRSKNGKLLGENIERTVQIVIEKPKVEFIGDGTIIPQTDQVIVPFRAIYTKGVKVYVYKIYSHNIGKMLASEDINGVESLGVVGRPVAVTTFYMDESSDFSRWHNYALDLSNLVKTEPGCIYHIELKLDQRLSAWPCDSVIVVDKEEMAKEDQLKFAEISDRFDSEIYYYYPSYWIDWSEYNYKEKDDPCTKSYYLDKYCSKNVLATNIGLTALSPSANKLTVVASNLLTAKPYSGVEVEVYNRQSHLFAKGTTDSDGRVDITTDGKEGKAFFIMARKNDDVSCLRVKRGEELSTSTFDVSGAEIQRGLKGYIYGERGVWRPGDTLHLSFMLNDREKSLPENHPVVMELVNPLGQTYRKMTKNNGQMGIYTFNIPTEPSDLTGSWLVNVQVGGTVFSKRIRIETIKPNRLKIDLKLPKELTYGEVYSPLHTEWLNGSKAHNQKYEISANFVSGKTSFTNWKEYEFDDPTKSFQTKEEELASGVTNESGNANVSIITAVRENAPGKLRCSVNTRVYEESGEFSTDAQILDYSPYERYVGIKMPKSKKEGFIPTGSEQKFELVALSSDGAPQSNVTLNVSVYRVEWYWWWNCSSYELANYTTDSYNDPVKTFTVSTNSQGKASFNLNFPDRDWGTYLIHVKDKYGEHSTGTLAYFDYPYLTAPRSMDGRETSSTLSINTDKDEYQPGETATINIPSTEGSRAIVTICNSAGILDMKFIECTGSQTSVSLNITDKMLPNVYAYVSLIQPYQHEGNDLPIRLYGVKPLMVTSKESKLNPIITASDEVKPLTKYTVKVSEKDGKKMAYTLAIVDEGLLDLTHFQTPNAWPVFFAKEAMSMRMWDLYNHVCGAFGGRIDQMFSVGGDEALNGGPKAVVNRFTPMVYFNGPFVVEKGKTNTHEIDVPNYNGRVRVMVVATDGEAYGSAEKSTFVKKPLMVTGTMPRQIGVNDEMTVSATLFTDGKVKSVKTTLECTGNLQVIGNNTATTEFSEAGDKTVQFKVKAGDKGGTGRVSIKCTSTSDNASYITDITIRSVSNTLKNVKTYSLKAGEQWEEKITAPGSEQQVIRMEASSVQPLNMASRIDELIRYPHGCAEQITSKAFPQLYLSEFAQLSSEQKQEVENNVKTVINKLAKYQTNDGGMAYWPGSSYPDRWVSAYVLLFLDKASEKGYYVNDKMKKNLAKYVASQARNWKAGSGSYDAHTAAFSLYALASVNAPEKSTMNRMKEDAAKLSDNDVNLLSASYALIGQASVAKQLLRQPTNSDYNYWCEPSVSNVIAFTLANDVRSSEYAEALRKELVSDEWMSTRKASMAMHAMNIFYKKNAFVDELKFVAKVNKKEIADVNSKTMSWNGILAKDEKQVNASVTNKSKGVMFLTVASEGLAIQEPIEAHENGVSVKVSYQMDNKCVDLDEVPQGATLKAIVTVTNTYGKNIENLAVTHILPSGFEALKSQTDSKINYVDLRDDRVLSYIDFLGKGSSTTIIVDLSATYAGKYYVPSIFAEAMYNNKINGRTRSGECIVK